MKNKSQRRILTYFNKHSLQYQWIKTDHYYQIWRHEQFSSIFALHLAPPYFSHHDLHSVPPCFIYVVHKHPLPQFKRRELRIDLSHVWNKNTNKSVREWGWRHLWSVAGNSKPHDNTKKIYTVTDVRSHPKVATNSFHLFLPDSTIQRKNVCTAW
jgi:hypothetical protein